MLTFFINDLIGNFKEVEIKTNADSRLQDVTAGDCDLDSKASFCSKLIDLDGLKSLQARKIIDNNH